MLTHRDDAPPPRRAVAISSRAGLRPHRLLRRPVLCRVTQGVVVGTLGIATIIAPLAGDVLAEGGHAAQARVQGAAAPAVQPVEDFEVVPPPWEQGDPPASVQIDAARVPTADELAARREAAGRASRELERVTLEQQWVDATVPGCDPAAIDVGAGNGRLDTAHMCELWGTGHLLRADAAVALARLGYAYRSHFGYDLVVTDSYRSYGAQVRVAARKPGLAARPGTSEHGWGLAVDFAGGVEVADHHYDWLLENAPAFGWDNPAWARKGGSSRYEPWHFEYVAGQAGGTG